MAIVPMQKISILVHKDDKSSIVDFLQNKGVLQIVDTPTEENNFLSRMGQDEEGGKLEFNVAQLDFAIGFLKKFAKEKKGLQAKIDGDAVQTNIDEIKKVANSFEFKEVISRCQSVDEELNSLNNEAKSIKVQEEKLLPWKQLKDKLNSPRITEYVESIFAIIALKEWDEFKTKFLNLSELIILECDSIYNDKVYAHIIVEKSLTTEINGLLATCKSERVELPEVDRTVSEELEYLDERLEQIAERQGQLSEAARELSKDIEKLRIVYDYNNWKRIQKEKRKHYGETESSALITGWMPKKSVKIISKEIENITKDFELYEINSDEGESAPVLMENKNYMKPFRAVTDIYGLPLYNEVDPTPFLAVFFIVYFGMCLTDAGYGIIMFISTWAILKYLRVPKNMENLVRLLMYGGILTFIMGILFGGWFGMTPDQAPMWMTTVVGDKILFKGQVFDSLGNAMQVLILSLGLGYFQILFGVWLNFIHKFRNENPKDALLDNFPWAYLLTIIALYILVFAGVLPKSISTPVLYLLYFGIGLIVITQGRKKSNIITKFLSGVLSLYDLVGYMSAVLSYSRLLALGLATAIIGMAANTIAGLANELPYIGIIFAIIILIIGHTFNLGVNALGSFIHSGRLQFVEFFGNFIEGGGAPFKPLRRDSKYVQIKK